MIMTGNPDLEEETLVTLIYDFKAGLEKEDFEKCQKIKDELERRDNESLHNNTNNRKSKPSPEKIIRYCKTQCYGNRTTAYRPNTGNLDIY